MIKNSLIHVILPLFLGGLIYWAARPSSLAFSQDIMLRPLIDVQYIPDWILFNLPDGLWTYALMSFTLLLWQDTPSVFGAKFWIITAFSLGIALEFGQYLHLIKGTFDWFDVLTYLIFNCLSIFTLNFKIREK